MDLHPPFDATIDDPNAPPSDISPGLSVLLFVVLPIAAVLLVTGFAWGCIAWRSRRARKRNETGTPAKSRDGKLVRRADIALEERAAADGRLGDTEGESSRVRWGVQRVADTFVTPAAFNLKLADLELGIERTESSNSQIPPPYDPAISGPARVG